MKTIQSTLLILFYLIIAGANAGIRPTLKFGAEVFQSPVSLPMMHFNKDQWQVRSENDVDKITNPAAYGVFAEIGFPAFSVFTRMGACNMAFKTESNFVTSLNGERIQNASSSSLKQHQLLFSLGVKRIHMFNKVSLGFGLEIPMVWHSTGELTESFSNKRYYAQSQQVNYEFKSSSYYAMPSGLTAGLGALIELSYTPVKRIQLCLLLSSGIYRQLIDQTIEMTYITENASYKTDGTLNSKASGLDSYTMHSEFKHTFFSRILPAFRVAYVLR